MEDVILALHRNVACLAAVGWGVLVGCPLVGLGVIVEERVPPAAGLRKPLAVLLDDESLGEYVGHIDVERLHGGLLRLPLQLHDLGALGERLAVAGHAGLVSLD